ncbi:site-specific recombinase XerD [Gillisia sp. Hel_I_86]|uniref:site-specific integrase n=1 Tax=Gillisia sp. Hel_I_86 TaxID=1249981 RepID=UPI00119AF9E2|nr:site-specific integrase [Gillisia sp. Hel_I_86]TVZ27872.1 site-specific recombinase XerD [Gillisia sp. Hel_I_86]
MRNSVTFGIVFIPKSSKAKNGKAPLYARITLNGERIELSLQRRITLNLWDERKSRLRGSSSESIQVNGSLDRIYNKIYESFRQLQNENKLLNVSAIKERYLGADDSFKKLSELLNYHTENMKSILKYGTMKNYYTTEQYLYKFLIKQFKSEDIYLKQINYQFITDFEHFLRTYKPKRTRKAPTNNGVMKHLERLKKLINLAQKLEWVEKDPFAKFTLKFKTSERAFLNEAELKSIENQPFNKLNHQQTRDVFIFSCYTGLSWIDAKNLKPEHIVIGIDGREWIFTAREKTAKPVKIPILPKAMEIIKKYVIHAECSGCLLPVYSNQKTNEYLKEIAKSVKLKKKLTFHVARHTFATTVTLSKGIPIESVSKLLGHSKLSTTQIYARVLESKLSEDMSKLF